MKDALKKFFGLFFESCEPDEVHSKPRNIVYLVVLSLFILYWIFDMICMLNNIDLSNIRMIIMPLYLIILGIDYFASKKK